MSKHYINQSEVTESSKPVFWGFCLEDLIEKVLIERGLIQPSAPAAPAPAVPVKVSVSQVSSTDAVVKWSAIPGAVRYVVSLLDDQGDVIKTLNVDAPATQVTTPKIFEAQKSYGARIYPMDNFSQIVSLDDNTAYFVTPAATPTAPTGTTSERIFESTFASTFQ